MTKLTISLYDSDLHLMPTGATLEIAQALRAGDIVLSDGTLLMQTQSGYELHKISYAGNDYHIAAPASFDATEQFSYDYIDKDNYLLTAVL